ncbi:unnamed protein product [Closterium sp. Naga37s-1]|nr:unnamed protein product [Closterium sp. Naga37s-1]
MQGNQGSGICAAGTPGVADGTLVTGTQARENSREAGKDDGSEAGSEAVDVSWSDDAGKGAGAGHKGVGRRRKRRHHGGGGRRNGCVDAGECFDEENGQEKNGQEEGKEEGKEKLKEVGYSEDRLRYQDKGRRWEEEGEESEEEEERGSGEREDDDWVPSSVGSDRRVGSSARAKDSTPASRLSTGATRLSKGDTCLSTQITPSSAHSSSSKGCVRILYPPPITSQQLQQQQGRQKQGGRLCASEGAADAADGADGAGMCTTRRCLLTCFGACKYKSLGELVSGKEAVSGNHRSRARGATAGKETTRDDLRRSHRVVAKGMDSERSEEMGSAAVGAPGTVHAWNFGHVSSDADRVAETVLGGGTPKRRRTAMRARGETAVEASQTSKVLEAVLEGGTPKRGAAAVRVCGQDVRVDAEMVKEEDKGDCKVGIDGEKGQENKGDCREVDKGEKVEKEQGENGRKELEKGVREIVREKEKNVRVVTRSRGLGVRGKRGKEEEGEVMVEEEGGQRAETDGQVTGREHVTAKHGPEAGRQHVTVKDEQEEADTQDVTAAKLAQSGCKGQHETDGDCVEKGVESTQKTGYEGRCETDGELVEKWLSCDECGKWRKVPGSYTYPDDQLWFCGLNPDPARRVCSDPEESVSADSDISSLPGFCPAEEAFDDGLSANVSLFVEKIRGGFRRAESELEWSDVEQGGEVGQGEMGLGKVGLGEVGLGKVGLGEEGGEAITAAAEEEEEEMGHDETAAAAAASSADVAHRDYHFVSSATLIVVPTTLVSHWLTQISRHVAPGALRVFVYDGVNQKAPAVHSLAWDYDVVVTTFSRLSVEWGGGEDGEMGWRGEEGDWASEGEGFGREGMWCNTEDEEEEGEEEEGEDQGKEEEGEEGAGTRERRRSAASAGGEEAGPAGSVGEPSDRVPAAAHPLAESDSGRGAHAGCQPGSHQQAAHGCGSEGGTEVDSHWHTHPQHPDQPDAGAAALPARPCVPCASNGRHWVTRARVLTDSGVQAKQRQAQEAAPSCSPLHSSPPPLLPLLPLLPSLPRASPLRGAQAKQRQAREAVARNAILLALKLVRTADSSLPLSPSNPTSPAKPLSSPHPVSPAKLLSSSLSLQLSPFNTTSSPNLLSSFQAFSPAKPLSSAHPLGSPTPLSSCQFLTRSNLSLSPSLSLLATSLQPPASSSPLNASLSPAGQSAVNGYCLPAQSPSDAGQHKSMFGPGTCEGGTAAEGAFETGGGGRAGATSEAAGTSMVPLLGAATAGSTARAAEAGAGGVVGAVAALTSHSSAGCGRGEGESGASAGQAGWGSSARENGGSREEGHAEEGGHPEKERHSEGGKERDGCQTKERGGIAAKELREGSIEAPAVEGAEGKGNRRRQVVWFADEGMQPELLARVLRPAAE